MWSDKGKKVVSLPRALSKLGFCSRSEAIKLIQSGLVKINSEICRDIKRRIILGKDVIVVNDKKLEPKDKFYLMLNKPRGLITTTNDEKNRDTVFQCFNGYNLDYVFPVGRLDKASEGLLLFTNDSSWANTILDPNSHIPKVYHVQIDKIPDDKFLRKLKLGVKIGNEILNVKSAKLIRKGKVNSWLEIILEEGKNRHIRRIMSELNVQVLRLIRVNIGNLKLGNLKKGQFRFLSKEEAENIFIIKESETN